MGELRQTTLDIRHVIRDVIVRSACVGYNITLLLPLRLFCFLPSSALSFPSENHEARRPCTYISASVLVRFSRSCTPAFRSHGQRASMTPCLFMQIQIGGSVRDENETLPDNSMLINRSTRKRESLSKDDQIYSCSKTTLTESK